MGEAEREQSRSHSACSCAGSRSACAGAPRRPTRRPRRASCRAGRATASRSSGSTIRAVRRRSRSGDLDDRGVRAAAASHVQREQVRPLLRADGQHVAEAAGDEQRRRRARRARARVRAERGGQAHVGTAAAGEARAPRQQARGEHGSFLLGARARTSRRNGIAVERRSSDRIPLAGSHARASPDETLGAEPAQAQSRRWRAGSPSQLAGPRDETAGCARTTLPRSAPVLRILTRRGSPPGLTPIASVNVPPVSIQICHGLGHRRTDIPRVMGVRSRPPYRPARRAANRRQHRGAAPGARPVPAGS